jgi:copper oxidase (laccase) domain-containing protein
MERLGARRERMRAAVGPCIARDSYEVDEGFRIRFVENDLGNASFFAEGPKGKPHFDLPGYVEHRLRSAGVRVENLGLDTYGEPDRFYSYRRSSHLGEADYGRQVSLIGLSGTSA